jgi:hypothetical protein
MTGRKYLLEFLKSISGNGRPRQIIIPYYLLDVCGDDYHAAALLNQILFWMDTTKHPEKWYARTYEDIKAELRMSKFCVMQAMKVLKPLGVETKTMMSQYHRWTRVVHYRISDDVIEKLIKQSLDQRVLTPSSEETEFHPPVSNQVSSLHESESLDGYYYKSSEEEEKEDLNTFASASQDAGALPSQDVLTDDGIEDDTHYASKPLDRFPVKVRSVQGKAKNATETTTTPPTPPVAPPPSSPAPRKLNALEYKIMTEVSAVGRKRVLPTTENMNCAAKLCDEGFMVCEKVMGKALYSLTDAGREALKNRSLTPQQALVKTLGEAFGIEAAGKDGGLYAKVAKALVEATIPADEFKQYVSWVRREAKKSGDWKVTISSLSEKGRPSEYVAARNAHKARTGVLLGSQVVSMLTPQINAYNPQSDPAYAQEMK